VARGRLGRFIEQDQPKQFTTSQFPPRLNRRNCRRDATVSPIRQRERGVLTSAA
jgi:hypothetical protein